jgi:hypothetical protein
VCFSELQSVEISDDAVIACSFESYVYVVNKSIYQSIPRLVTYLIYLSMALQSSVGPWPLFQFLNLIHSRQESLDGGSARRKAATYTQNNTNTE